jgi:glycosyltransferase involved in cell wall biosynthesis
MRPASAVVTVGRRLVGEPRIYLVGARFRHHAGHSGYEQFGRYAGSSLPRVPVPFDGWRARRLEMRATAALAGAYMRVRDRAIFHALYGDRDLELLARVAGGRRDRLLATLHLPAGRIMRRPRLTRAIERLQVAVLVSRSQREALARLLPQERLFVVPHGVDAQFFSPNRSPQPREPPTLIAVGSAFRDFPTLADALAAIWRRMPSVRLLAVGVSPWAKGLLGARGWERVTFLDGITDEQLRAAYQRAHAGVFAFTEATASNALLEAMACGVPLIASDVGGVREYVGDHALLCPPGEPHALAEAVQSVLDDDALARRLADGARARSLRYSYERVGRQMIELYHAIAHYYM